MQPNIRWLDDPRVFAVGRRDAHSDHAFFASLEDCHAGNDTLRQSLDGVWKFAYSVNAKERPADFYREDYDGEGFGEIAVPGHIELAGYDKLHYINTMYPWEGHYFRRPAECGLPGADGVGQFSEADYNPVGSYVKMFDLDEGLRGKRVIIRFEGVEQAMYVWLNGKFLGYAEDTFTPSEFDLTDAIREEGNILAVEVHKRSTAAYLEDQDFFRFFGIFRSVNLFALPQMHADDVHVRPLVDLDTKSGCVKAALKLSAAGEIAGTVRVRILEGETELCACEAAAAPQVSVEMTLPGSVTLWDHHNPYLYRAQIELCGADGAVCEVIPVDFGFRKVEIRDGVVLLNGKRLVINGVNRHEWNAHTGRCITDADEAWDIACFKRNHINAVRTCHYPDRLSWYALCDREGIYMMSETNLESHGSWQKAGAIEPSWNVPGSLDAWGPITKPSRTTPPSSSGRWATSPTPAMCW